MKILALGHFCHDVIHTPDGREIRSPGGIAYAAAALAATAGRSDRVVPVFGVHHGDLAAVLEDLRRFPAIDPAGIYAFEEPTNQVHLVYGDGGTRIECSRHIAAPIPFERIRPHLAADGILVNMISGSDLTLETLDQIRMAVRPHTTPLHLDVHSLTLGVRPDHERYRRPVDEWRRWAFMIDTVQMNEEEIAGLTPDRMSETQTVGHLLTLGVRGVLVTRGERGVTLYAGERKRVTRTDIPGQPVPRAVDATGCGDVFGAVFFQHYLRNGSMAAAAEAANAAAARKAGSAGTGGLAELLAAPPQA